jgi:hypothetical protein
VFSHLVIIAAVPCALIAPGAFLAFNAQKFYGDWRQASPLTRVVRRMFGAAIVMRLVGVSWIVFGLATLAFVAVVLGPN